MKYTACIIPESGQELQRWVCKCWKHCNSARFGGVADGKWKS